MERAAYSGDTKNRRRLASCWLSAVLDMAFKSRVAGGRKPVSNEVRALIFRMVAENPTWGAPRIHGELLKLGFDLSEPTVSRWVRRAPRSPDPDQRWLTFLRHHREAIAAMDFFTVPILTFGVLYCFFVIGHDRRRILHHNLTRNPNALWIELQLHEVWEYGEQPERFLIVDRDAKFSADVISIVKAMGSQAIRTAFPQSMAEWGRGALGWQCASRSPGSCDRAASETSATVAK